MTTPSPDSSPSLARWYAEPLSPDAAQARLENALHDQRQAHRQGQSCTRCRVEEMIARFWLGRPVRAQYETLRAEGPDSVQALAELLYGQLLMACKLRDAMAHLRRGFELAATHLSAEDYFVVLRRHELLAQLPLSSRPSPAQGLEALLREAAVIRRLRGPGAGQPPTDRGDTVG